MVPVLPEPIVRRSLSLKIFAKIIPDGIEPNIYDIDIKVGILLSELILFYRLFFNNDLNLIGAIAIYITYEFSFLLIYRCNLYSKERYYTVGVEGMSILMGVLFFFSQRFFG